MGWQWYGVRTVFRSRAQGKPDRYDPSYDPKATLVEERVVVVKGRSVREALGKARAEARTYVRGSHLNPYGQRVRASYLGVADVSPLYVDPQPPGEVFWSTYVVPSNITDAQLIRRLTPPSVPNEDVVRRKFLNREFGRFREDG
jgi:uncharacterized protein DUF4288